MTIPANETAGLGEAFMNGLIVSKTKPNQENVTPSIFKEKNFLSGIANGITSYDEVYNKFYNAIN